MPKLKNDGMQLIRETGVAQWWGNGHYMGGGHPWLVRDALCEDGRRRTAYLGPDADTFFSWPARVKIEGKWVKGFVGAAHDADGVTLDDTAFTAYKYTD